jgi:hypothetical protein
MSAEITDGLVYDETTEAAIIQNATTFTTKPFYVDRDTSICCGGLVSNSVDIQFGVRLADGTYDWESTGTVLDATTKIQTSFGPGYYKLVRSSGTESLTVTLYRSRRK